MKKRISIFANMTKTNAVKVLDRAIEAAEAAGFTVKSYTNAYDLFADASETEPELIVTIGGDGTMLKTLSTGVNHGFMTRVPILGINLGKIGFFTETDIDGFAAALERFKAGEYRVEEASMLKCTTEDGFEFICLNEFYVTKNAFTPVAQIEMEIDGLPTGMINGDGIIVCSSTGSTGYSISAGGPIAAPGLEAMFITPVCPTICPHSLTVRPIAAPISASVKIDVRSECLLYADGAQLMHLPKNSFITIRAAEQKAAFVRIGNRSVFKLIREKLA